MDKIWETAREGEDEDEFVSGNDLESNHLKHMHIGLETKLARRKNQVLCAFRGIFPGSFH